MPNGRVQPLVAGATRRRVGCNARLGRTPFSTVQLHDKGTSTSASTLMICLA